jgi:hypothetical protein
MIKASPLRLRANDGGISWVFWLKQYDHSKHSRFEVR